VGAFYCEDNSALWAGIAQPLPVEIGDFRFSIAATGWTVSGTRANGDVVIETPRAVGIGDAQLRPYSPTRRILNVMLCRAGRPDNLDAKYRQTAYHSLQPFCGLSAENHDTGHAP
jgi:hypothetical protein